VVRIILIIIYKKFIYSKNKRELRTFPSPIEKSIIYQDKKLYVCLAKYQVTKGHIIVIWNKPISDLHLLAKKDYENACQWLKDSSLKRFIDLEK